MLSSAVCPASLFSPSLSLSFFHFHLVLCHCLPLSVLMPWTSPLDAFRCSLFFSFLSSSSYTHHRLLFSLLEVRAWSFHVNSFLDSKLWANRCSLCVVLCTAVDVYDTHTHILILTKCATGCVGCVELPAGTFVCLITTCSSITYSTAGFQNHCLSELSCIFSTHSRAHSCVHLAVYAGFYLWLCVFMGVCRLKTSVTISVISQVCILLYVLWVQLGFVELLLGWKVWLPAMMGCLTVCEGKK